MADPVNHPDHYNQGGIEAIDVIDAFNLNFNLGNVIKYVLRARKKGEQSRDLRKAAWYLQREIENHEAALIAADTARSLTSQRPIDL